MGMGGDEQSVVVNQLIAEFKSRIEAGEALNAAQFIAAHPEHAAELERHFANVNVVEVNVAEGGTPEGGAETIATSGEVGELSSEDATAHTVVRGSADSKTSVAHKHQNNTGSATSIQIPKTFGRYAIQKVLGQGAMGAVYLAKDTQLDRDVALKIPKFGDCNGVAEKELLERFYREARASATLRSPNICPVYDVGEIDGQHYITMAYIEGRPLKDFTKSKKSHSEKQIITTVRKLALGLDEAHKIGVIHRDLKPANIMVDQYGEPVVMDFGLARRSSSDDVQVTQSGAILGTPAYMAPEQVAGDQAAIDHQVDIYALGIIMYELITGEMPFKGNLMALLQQIALNNPKKPSELRKDIDPRLETICLKMIAGDQKKRYQSMSEVAADLQDVLRNPGKRQKKEQAKKTGPKPTSIPSAHEESNPALISVAQPKSYTEQLREKKKLPKPVRTSGKSSSNRKKKATSASGLNGPTKKLLIAGGLGGLVLLLGILLIVRVGKYDVQITLDDPSITLSVDGEVLNINDGEDVYKLSAGKHKLKLQKDGLKTHVEEFTVAKDGKTAVRVVVLNGQLDGLLNGEKPRRSSLPPKKSQANERTKTQVASVSNYGLQFDGVKSKAVIPNFPSVNGGPFTIEAMLRFDEPDKKCAFLTATDFNVYTIKEKQNKLYLWQQLGRQVNASATDIGETEARQSDGHLIHFAGVWDGKETRIYLNGKLNSYSRGQFKIGWNPSSDLLIGHEAGDNPVFFPGVIDELRYSNVARYQSEFTPPTNNSRLAPDQGTLALYHFDEGVGDVIKDASGNGYDGKVIGAKWVGVSGGGSTPERASGEPVQYALEFDGQNSVDIPDTTWSERDEFTFEAYVRAGSVQNQDAPLVFVVNQFSTAALVRARGHWGFMVNFGEKAGVMNSKASQPAVEGEWTHLAGVFRNGTVQLFVNGEPMKAVKLPDKISSESGKYIRLGVNFVGAIRQFKISKSARYAKRFEPPQQMMNDVDTLVLYKFHEGIGDVLKDSSGNGYHGKIIGAKWVRSVERTIEGGQERKVSLVEMLTSPDYEWTEPVNLGPQINSVAGDNHPTLTADGLILMFESDRGDGAEPRLYECRRSSLDAPWSSPRPVDELNKIQATDPQLSRDGLSLLFSRPSHGKNEVIWSCRRPNLNAPWQEPVYLGDEVNPVELQGGADLSPDGLTLYFRAWSGQWKSYDLFVAHRNSVDAPWSNPSPMGSDFGSVGEIQPLADGKTLLFAQGGSGTHYIARRGSDGKFEKQKLQANFTSHNFVILEDGTAFFTSAREGTFGKGDIWTCRLVLKDKAADGASEDSSASHSSANAPSSAMASFDSTHGGLLFDQPGSHVAVDDLKLDLQKPWTCEFWCQPADCHWMGTGSQCRIENRQRNLHCIRKKTTTPSQNATFSHIGVCIFTRTSPKTSGVAASLNV
ncbi:protein kinase domain-containing protein [Thalassoglobus polymorphus]|uniref:non-specific serine/threonine protein kinase n=1 Tax=Thalassoglobus polymorphus TaxID=2527994 RepID=A0A517QNQ2_9PLAN|nr:LamG-like jellyroll fold domain-containing protein [Thalassoglobus polymorphus]QDT33268.1 Serine/threonine-protein kinase PknB [Thalassoglobus polymorphus]